MLFLKFIFTILLCGCTQVIVAQTIAVMSYNIHHGADKEERDRVAEIGAFIKSSAADIVGLQEVDSVCLRTKGVDQMKKLAGITGMYYAFVRHFAYQGGAYGMGILSRYPIENVENKRMPLLNNKNPSTAMITAVIQLPENKKIKLASAHFALDDSSRMLQAAAVVTCFKQEKIPVIFTGDLNAEPNTPEIRFLKEYFAETDAANIFTFPAPVATKKIDYIFIRKPHLKKIKQYTVPVNALSDHLPVIAEMELK
ncbi:endonuclease/exonuclease/phosphatase family protein [Niabella aquatica]